MRMTPLRLALPLALLLASPLVVQAQAPVAPVRTSFDPRLDGMPFENTGDYASDGNCFGMSLLAVDNYLRRMRARAAGQPDPAPLPITESAQDGHLEAQMLASLVQAIASAQDDGDNSPVESRPASDAGPMREALERMRRTGEPHLMGIYAPNGDAHEIVVFGYEDGNLLIYDPNYPGETIRWPWDPRRGFGPHPKRRDDPGMYGKLDEYDTGPLDTFRTGRELQALRDACAQGLDRCVGRFHALTGRREGNVITGKVGPGLAAGEDGSPARPRRVWVVVDGKPVASGPIRADGTFRVALPRRTPAGARVQLVAVTEDGLLAGANDLVGPPSRTRGLAGVLGGVGD
jgi:hypothetical protein